MAKLYSNAVRVHFGGYDIGSALTSVAVAQAVVPLDPTALGDAAERQLAGIRQDTVEWAGIFDDSLSSDAAGAAMLGSGTNNVLQVHIGTGTGSLAYAGTVLMVSHKVAASKSELVMAEGEFKADGKLYRGNTLLTKTTFTGSGSSEPADFGTISTGTSALFVQIFSFSGAGSGSLFLQGATTATGVYTSIATILAATATKSYIALGTGTLNQWTRIIKTATGTLEMAAVVVRNYS